jgi:hypothetical protein
MKIDGRCHCGEIELEAEINPDITNICHCTDCQTISGAPYRVSVVASTRGLSVSGTPKQYQKRGDSGDLVVTNFCGTCGTALYSFKGEKPAFIFLRIGPIRQRAALKPTKQGFCGSALPWATNIADVPVVS